MTIHLKKKNLTKLLIILALIFYVLLYTKSFTYFFVQDDFFHLRISRANDVVQYLNFFKPRSDIIGYRPISIQNYFFIMKFLFGLDPFGYRVFNLIILGFTTYIIYKVMHIISKDEIASALTAFFWSTSSVHFTSVTWISANYTILGTFFFVLSLLLFLKYTQNKRILLYVTSFLLFILSLGSFEFAFSIPIIALFYLVLGKKKPYFYTIKNLGPFFLVNIIYLIFRIFIKNNPDIEEYKMAINFELFRNLFWYVLWTFNIPEEFKKQIIDNLIIFNKRFLEDYWLLVFKTFFISLISISAVIAALIFEKFRKLLPLNILLFAILWFLISILPTLFFIKHSFIYYLPLASVGLYLLLALAIISFKQFKFIVLFIAIWLYGSYTTTKFYYDNSYLNLAQKKAKDNFLKLNQNRIPITSKDVIFYPINSFTERVAVSDNNIVKVVYNNPEINVYTSKTTLITDYKMGG